MRLGVKGWADGVPLAQVGLQLIVQLGLGRVAMLIPGMSGAAGDDRVGVLVGVGLLV